MRAPIRHGGQALEGLCVGQSATSDRLFKLKNAALKVEVESFVQPQFGVEEKIDLNTTGFTGGYPNLSPSGYKSEARMYFEMP